MKSEKLIKKVRNFEIKMDIEIAETPPFPFNSLISYY